MRFVYPLACGAHLNSFEGESNYEIVPRLRHVITFEEKAVAVPFPSNDIDEWEHLQLDTCIEESFGAFFGDKKDEPRKTYAEIVVGARPE